MIGMTFLYYHFDLPYFFLFYNSGTNGFKAVFSHASNRAAAMLLHPM